MRILLLGATGRTGKLILGELLKTDAIIHVLVRDARKLELELGSISIFEGLPNQKSDLKRAMQGCQTVINALNISRNSDFPWANLRTPLRLISETMQNVIELAESIDTQQIISISAWGVNETRQDIPFWFRGVIDWSNIGVAYKDHKRQEELLECSSFNWTIIQPVGLFDSEKLQEVRVSIDNSPKPSLMISRLSVARFIANLVGKSDFQQQKVVLSTKT